MKEKEIKLGVLSKILESKEFQSSKTKKKLLQYLVDASINNKEVKEYTIATEVFEKEDFNPAEDSSVRVYISNLRKKLEDYYRDCGVNDKIRISIPKGHYEVSFIDAASQEEFDEKTKIAKYQKYLIVSVIVIILLFAFALYEFFNKKEVHYDNSFIWNDFNNSKMEKTLILGNDLFYLTGEDENETIMRKHFINSIPDFENYKQKVGLENAKSVTPYPFFPISSISSLPILLNKINLSKCKLLYSSKVTIKDLLNNDIIFFGSFRNLYFLNRLLKDNYLQYTLIQNHISLTINDADSSRTFNLFGEPDSAHSDYCLLRKIPGPNKTIIIMFIAFFDTGIHAAMNSLNDPEKSKILEKRFIQKYKEVPTYFDILFKVSGYSRTGYNIQIADLHKIDPAKLKIWK